MSGNGFSCNEPRLLSPAAAPEFHAPFPTTTTAAAAGAAVCFVHVCLCLTHMTVTDDDVEGRSTAALDESETVKGRVRD